MPLVLQNHLPSCPAVQVAQPGPTKGKKEGMRGEVWLFSERARRQMPEKMDGKSLKNEPPHQGYQSQTAAKRQRKGLRVWFPFQQQTSLGVGWSAAEGHAWLGNGPQSNRSLIT